MYTLLLAEPLYMLLYAVATSTTSLYLYADLATPNVVRYVSYSTNTTR
jgi:hypothetical protein